jgi:hypothetical protein
MGIRSIITYTNYPQDNPEYAGAGLFFGGTVAATSRFPSVYEILDVNWQIDIEFMATSAGLSQEIDQPDIKTTILSAASDLSEVGNISIMIDNKPIQAKVTIKGTYTKVFDQRQYDIRMLDESLLEDADIDKIGDKYYAPYNYIPDRRVWLENGFTVKVEVPPSVNQGLTGLDGIFTFYRQHTVLNNWEANRRRLLQIRDNLNRGEQIERNQYNGIANSPNEFYDDPAVPAPDTTSGTPPNTRTYAVPAAPIERVTETNPNVAN